jgi:hypothetical protein
MTNAIARGIGTWNGLCGGTLIGMFIAHYLSPAGLSFTFQWLGLLLVFIAFLPDSFVAIAQGIRRSREVSKRVANDR